MRAKIQENIKLGRYAKHEGGASAFFNTKGRWWDHLLSERIIFSHRTNGDTDTELFERLHSHDYYELTLVAEGVGVEYIADSARIPVCSGMVILTKPLHFHMFRLSASAHYERYVMYFKHPELIFPSPILMSFARMGNTACAVFPPSESSLIMYAQRARKALQSASCYASAEAYLHICQLFLEISKREAVICATTPHSVPVFIHEIKEYIDKNFLDIHSVDTLAKQFFYSREHISRSFKRYYNTPIYDYILNRRLLFSASLLQKGERVELAARLAGFVNMASFIKLFRKHYGCTPSEYRGTFI